MEQKIGLAELNALLDKTALLKSAAEKIRLATEDILARERIRILEDFCKSAWCAKALPFMLTNISRTHFRLLRPAMILSEPIFGNARVCFLQIVSAFRRYSAEPVRTSSW